MDWFLRVSFRIGNIVGEGRETLVFCRRSDCYSRRLTWFVLKLKEEATGLKISMEKNKYPSVGKEKRKGDNCCKEGNKG